MNHHDFLLLQTKQTVPLHLTASEIKALECIHKIHFKKSAKPNLRSLASWVLRLALQHPKEISQWFNALNTYCQSEGVEQNAHVVGCIAAHSAYRRGRAKEVAS